MVKTSYTPINSFDLQNKDNRNTNQLKTIFQFLFENIATASMVSEATGISQKNICRYKRDLEKENRLWEIEKKVCEKTGFLAWHLTTNPAKVTKYLSTQLNLFEL
jgi:hypothetical protein